MTRVIVTWMDGQTETYDCEQVTTEGGVLYLHRSGEKLGAKTGIPVANVRYFRIER